MKPVTRAVLLAAGRGSRLGALTENFPKGLIEVGGSPILHRIIAGLADANVSDITVITGHAAAALESATGGGDRWGVKLTFLRQRDLDGTARALTLAREQLAGESFFMGWADVAVEAANYRQVIETAGSESAIAVNSVEDPSAGGAVYVDADFRVTRIVEKPPPGTSTTPWNNAGLVVLTPQIWPFVERLAPSARGEYELPEAMAAFVEARNLVRAVPIEGPWFDVGTPESLAAARAHFDGRH